MLERSTVVGVFEDRIHAQQAINELKRAGFRDDQIGLTARDHTRATATDVDETDDSYAGEGGMAGVAAGAGIGALWGLGVIAGALPAIGPAIAGGTLAAILSSAAAGAAATGVAGALIGMGVPKDEAEYYESEVGAGRVVVTVHAEARAAEAVAVLRSHNAYDMSTRGMGDASSSRSDATLGTSSDPTDIRVPVSETDIYGEASPETRRDRPLP